MRGQPQRFAVRAAPVEQAKTGKGDPGPGFPSFPSEVGSLGCRRHGLLLALSHVPAAAASRATLKLFSRALRQKTAPADFGPFLARAREAFAILAWATLCKAVIGKSLMIGPS